MTIPLGPGREFDLIRRLVAHLGDAADEIGDDAAAVMVPPGETLLVSTDTTVEHVHFRPGWLSPQEIGYRAMMSAMSDLAAMGATPRAAVLAWTLPDAWRPQVERLGDGIREAALQCGAKVVGGDVSGGSVLALAVTVLGSTKRVLRRSGARVGDAVYVTGSLGGPLLALRALEAGRTPEAHVRDRFARPTARIKEGAWLAAHGATAAIDISDGVAADLGHMAAASGVQIALDIATLPRVAEATWDDAAMSGEEYELAVTGPADIDSEAFRNAFGVPLTLVGGVSDGPAGVVARCNGVEIDLPNGFDHFSH